MKQKCIDPIPIFKDGSKDVIHGLKEVGTKNHYVSTRLNVRDSYILIDGHKYKVKGKLCFNREWGFITSYENKYISQTIQLNKGIHIFNYYNINEQNPLPNIKQKVRSRAVVQMKDGCLHYVNSFITPGKTTWISPCGQKYFMTFKIEIPHFKCKIIMKTLFQDQEAKGYTLGGSEYMNNCKEPFYINFPHYQGVSRVKSIFMGNKLRGDGINEQVYN